MYCNCTVGSLTLPNLEVAIQQHRQAMNFAIGSNNVFDATLYAEAINALLPLANRLQIATPTMVLGYNPNVVLRCPHCRTDYDLKLEMLRDAKLPNELPKRFVLPKPPFSTLSQELRKSEYAWQWFSTYMIKLEGNISDLTWQKIRQFKE